MLEKWERDMNSRADQQQLIFIDGRVTRKPPKPVVQVAVDSRMATCPFCLHQSSTDKFAVSCKKGFNKRLGKCPECKNQSMWMTLHRKWKIKEFALFVYNYSREGFWSKCKYPAFNGRLRLIGQLDNFWNEYRRLKGDPEFHTESTEEYYNRKQREEAEAQGYTVTENAT